MGQGAGRLGNDGEEPGSLLLPGLLGFLGSDGRRNHSGRASGPRPPSVRRGRRLRPGIAAEASGSRATRIRRPSRHPPSLPAVRAGTLGAALADGYVQPYLAPMIH